MSRLPVLIFIPLFCHSVLAAEPVDFDRSTKTFRQTLEALVRAKPVNPPGNEARATEILAARLKAEGIPFQTMEFAPGRTNLVARLKGTGEKKPLLLLAHTDVVGTENQDWSVPPHELTEKDGFLYGRGTRDDLSMAVSNLETFINLKRSGEKLKRDVILAFTGDEESGGSGIRAMLEKHPEWVDAEIGLNEGGALIHDETGKVTSALLSVAEKTYQDFTLLVKGTTGHSSVPKGDNAIYLMSAALDRLAKFKPKERLLPATREYFKKRATLEKKPEVAKAMTDLANATGALPKKALAVLEKDPLIGPQLFTTCIPTTIQGGVRMNSLPPDVKVNINCRILPDEPITNVERRLAQIIQDPRIQISKAVGFGVGGASPVAGTVPDAVRKVMAEMFPGAPVIASMVTGATDSRFLRTRDVQMYGLSPISTMEIDFARSHGIDERISVSAIRPGLEYEYRLVLELAR